MNLWRVAIDEKTGHISGAPEPVTLAAAFAAHFATARETGALIYTSVLQTNAVERYSLDDADGSRRPVTIFSGSLPVAGFDVSPDGNRIAFAATNGSQEDLFLMNRRRRSGPADHRRRRAGSRAGVVGRRHVALLLLAAGRPIRGLHDPARWRRPDADNAPERRRDQPASSLTRRHEACTGEDRRHDSVGSPGFPLRVAAAPPTRSTRSPMHGGRTMAVVSLRWRVRPVTSIPRRASSSTTSTPKRTGGSATIAHTR